ncbi:three-helix bundle dimerization domain-containing protein [Nocardia sp. CA-151230]|uniref:three-helix bundle dimerization domain-containing protein n=1 Tax=Nocardia sp. CA-151230 TaxID=3239982 RepID=UPI003D8FFA02
MIDDEDTQIRFVLERLTRRHPDLAHDDVAAIVGRAHAHFTDSRVRKFVPLLVERRVRIELASLAS